jgi:c(7)-type cytochrome triheme protein
MFSKKNGTNERRLIMKKIGMYVLTVVVVLGMASLAMAVGPGKTVEFDGKGSGKVIFDGKLHADKGAKCVDCHVNPKLFQMKKGVDVITMKAMEEGKVCGTCHNGTKSFGVKDKKDCAKCHKK